MHLLLLFAPDLTTPPLSSEYPAINLFPLLCNCSILSFQSLMQGIIMVLTVNAGCDHALEHCVSWFHPVNTVGYSNA